MQLTITPQEDEFKTTNKRSSSTRSSAAVLRRRCVRRRVVSSNNTSGASNYTTTTTRSNSKTSSQEEDTNSSSSISFPPPHVLLSPEDVLSDQSWVTSPLIDLMFYHYAKQYPSVHFLPSDFVPLALSSDVSRLCDVLGRQILSHSKKDMVFVVNHGSVHWNLYRISNETIECFEPMGRPVSRRGRGVGFRAIPHSVIAWLDRSFPLKSTWRQKTVNAITTRHQMSGFDCGVACLLYAEKCGQGINAAVINDATNQREITSFRKTLQCQLAQYLSASSSSTKTADA